MERLETEIYLRYKQIIESQGIVVPAAGESPTPRRVRMEDLLDRYDAFCFDGYGTLYNRGSFVYDGALDWYTMLRAAGKQMRLITNAASDVDSVLAADAAKRGFAFSEAETISSGSLLKDLCDELRGRGKMVREVYYIGRETGKHVLERCGITAVALDAEPAEPIVAISSAKDTPESYAQAAKILQKPGAMLLVLNSDAWAPKIPDNDGVLCRERFLKGCAVIRCVARMGARAARRFIWVSRSLRFGKRSSGVFPRDRVC